MRSIVAFAAAALFAVPAAAQETAADQVRAEVRAAFGVALPDIENHPDSMVAGAWAWMNDVEDGGGAIDAMTFQLIALAVAAQIPCRYCT